MERVQTHRSDSWKSYKFLAFQNIFNKILSNVGASMHIRKNIYLVEKQEL